MHIGTAQHANYAGKFRKAHCNSRHVGFKKASCSPDLRWSAADLCQRKPCSAGSRCLIDTCFRWRDQFSQHLWTCTSSKERLVSSCRLNPLRATSSTTFQFIGQANEKEANESNGHRVNVTPSRICTSWRRCKWKLHPAEGATRSLYCTIYHGFTPFHHV